MSPQSNFLTSFNQIVTCYPDQPAIINNGDQIITYQELYKSAQSIASQLKSFGIVREEIIGLALNRSPEYIIAMLAVWFAGAAFLPLDPTLPFERLAFMLTDSQCQFIITKDQHQDLFNQMNIRSLLFEQLIIDQSEQDLPLADIRDNDLAYCIYTSGSTGSPKGVLIEHRGILNFLQAQIETFQLSTQSRALCYLSFNFDASISDIGSALLSGATLFIESSAQLNSPGQLLEILKTRGITHIDLPPSLLRIFAPNQMPATLQTIIIGGEVCPPAIVRNWAKYFRIVNVYGPTEATVCTSMAVCSSDDWSQPFIGEPISQIAYHLLDEDLQPVSSGTPAELFISGIGLARGYLNRDQLTATKFISHNGQRLYRTGDLVVAHAAGRIEFLGRIDRQFKLHGRLIEPDEIEAQLLNYPDIQAAVVIKKNIRLENSRNRDLLIALLVLRSPLRTIDRDGLRSHLLLKLPEWMLPQHYQYLTELPRTITGKVDLKQLEAMPITEYQQATTNNTNESSTAGSPTEILIEIWQRVLGIKNIDIEEDLYTLGGDSLSLIEISAAAEAHGLSISPALIARFPTIAGIVTALSQTVEIEIGAISCQQLQRDVDRLTEKLLTQDLPGPSSREFDKNGAILITGAAGFLATRLLAQLLQSTKARIYCLLRANDEGAAWHRLKSSLQQQQILLTEAEQARIAIICADLSQERFGLTASNWQQLSDEISRVYHCAATVNILQPYAQLFRSNVLGTAEIVRFCANGQPKQLHYASTLSVFVATDRNKGRLLECDNLADTKVVYGGYAQTKWVAERLLDRLSQQLGSVSIYRFGLITGDSATGINAPHDFFSHFIRGLRELGCVPKQRLDQLKIDITPIDYAAAAMVYLSLNNSQSELIRYHIANEISLTLADLIDYLRTVDIEIREITDEEWRQQVVVTDNQAASAAYLALCRCLSEGAFEYHRIMDLFQATGVEFDLHNTNRDLTGSGISCPAPTRELLEKYFRNED